MWDKTPDATKGSHDSWSQDEVAHRLLDRLDRVLRNAGGWSARCPAHEDKHPSLSIGIAPDGGVLIHCFVGCTRAQILSAVGIQERELHPSPSSMGTLPMGRGGRQSGVPDATSSTGRLTLAALAAAKALPVEVLRSLGCTDDRRAGVKIPYHDVDGTLVAIRTRPALTGDRFRWRRGDHPLLYGLWKLQDIRSLGWVLLVEGETDCWTLWELGIPALGIPGKNTWRPEWSEHLMGLRVFLWQEPDAADLVDRVARDLTELRVIVAPDGTKDVSDAHVRGDDVVALVDQLRGQAIAAASLRDGQMREIRRVALAAASSVLSHPDPLELVEAEITAQGYGGDVRAPLLAYLAATGRILAQRPGSIPCHLLFIGPSSGGKNAAMRAGLRLLPEEAVHVIDAGSPRVLIYDEAPLEHRVVVFSEADSLPAGEDNPAASAIRNLLQDGHLHYQVTVRDPGTGDFTVRDVDKAGPTVLMTTSTKPLGPQLMTRVFSVEIPDEPAQMRAALAAQARLELEEPPPSNAALVAFQAYLGGLAPMDVIVPFVVALQAGLADQGPGPRVLRDFPRLLSLIKAVALVRMAHRANDARGRLVAEIDDYRVVHRLVADTYEASVGASKRIRATVAAVGELSNGKGLDQNVTVTEVAKRLGVSMPSASRRVREAISGKWLVNDEQRKSQTAKLRLGEPLPASSMLPTPESLVEVGRESVAPDHEGGFTISPDTAVPPSLEAEAPTPDVGYPVVFAENVQSGQSGGDPFPLALNFGIFVDEEEWGTGSA